jgi:two-component system, OmpR family, response regulator
VKVLVIEDDRKIATIVRRGLEAEAFTVDVAYDGLDGLWQAREGSYDLIVLDIMLPGRNGYLVCGDLRAEGDWTPILMLTAKAGELDEAEGLDTGADDYLTKPFSLAVLAARARALVRRGQRRGAPEVLTAGDVRVDSLARRAWRGEVEVTLTARQFDLLEYMVRHQHRVLSKQALLDGVWPFDFDGDVNIVEVYVKRLRAALDEPFGTNSIVTVRGTGYRMVPS